MEHESLVGSNDEAASREHHNGYKMSALDYLMKLSPFVILAFSGYFIYVYCYLFCWQVVRGARGIVMICIFSVLSLLIITSWVFLLLIGPGYLIPIPSEELDGSSLPEVFMCDPQGYRQWCSFCQSIKPDRAHHLIRANRCIPKLDHYCVWLSAIVGENNYKLFVQYAIYFWLIILYILTTLVIFEHGPGFDDALKEHKVAIYVIGGVFFALITGFLGVQLRYIYGNLTTIEHMDLARKYYPIFNIECDGKRVVTKLYKSDLFPHGPYSHGAVRNWKSIMGPTVWHWLLPMPYRPQPSRFNQELLETLRTRFRRGKEGYLAFTQKYEVQQAAMPPEVTQSSSSSMTSTAKNKVE